LSFAARPAVESEPLVCPFVDCRRDSLELVGGKVSSLGELINAGVRVPPGFAITTHAFRRFFSHAGLDRRVRVRLGALDERDLDALESACAQVRDWIEAAPLSLELEDLVAEHYRRLSMHCSVAAVPVAVRSSATAEDLPGASFAGQQDTYLWVRGVDDLLAAIRRCFASLYTARAVAYRIRMGFAHELVALGVGVQKMANSQAAGVMFTLNPANGDRSSIVINSNFGFGESVVSGDVTPDEFLVNKISLEVMRRTIPSKAVYDTVDRANHCSRRYELPPERRSVQSILDDDIAELAQMGRAIEEHYGRPMDIEWAVDGDMPSGGNIFILQARPETVWSARPNAPARRASAIDHILASVMTGKSLG
jgi:pyruvate,water dikinase